jgi:hypothetical protein
VQAQRRTQTGGKQNMRKKIRVPKWAWRYYRACQDKALNGSGEPEEETLNFLVQLFCKRKIPATVPELEKLVDNHLAGNRQKLRRRNELLEKYSPSMTDRPDDRLASRDSIEVARQRVTLPEWHLLRGIACGFRYQELSDDVGVPVGTLKSTVSRVRTNLQEMGVN